MIEQQTLPNGGWHTRPDQKPLWEYLNKTERARAVVVAHRRWGKDDVALHFTAKYAFFHPGTYWHMLPEAEQARKAIWDAINPKTGKRRIDEAFGDWMCEAKRDKDMLIRIAGQNGPSTWQVVGSDNYNSLVGAPPKGIVFSEWALADPNAWAYLRPILQENGGWALFIYTPRGRNHGATFYEAAKADPRWYAQKLTARDTPVFTEAQLEEERGELIREFGEDDGLNRFNQEYLCDFNAAIVGSYYGRLMTEAEGQGRIDDIPHEVDRKVHTAWDIGVSDSTAIWFIQFLGRKIHVIDYLENSGVGLDWYARELKTGHRAKYLYGEHIWPHDGDITEWGNGIPRIKSAQQLGINPRVLKARHKQDSINGVRVILPRCWFDKTKCERGINALRMYRRQWDDKRKTFHDKPVHDWASHGSDAFAEFAAADIHDGDSTWGKPLAYPEMGIV